MRKGYFFPAKLIAAALASVCATLPAMAAPAVTPVSTTGATVVVSLSGDHATDSRTVSGLAQLDAPARQVLVSTESDTEGPLTPLELSMHVSHARQITGAEVSAAKRWDFWLAHPELAEASDFIATTIFPDEHGVAAAAAVEFALERWVLLREAYPDKRIVVVATDWPDVTAGTERADYRSGFGVWAKALGIEYYLGALPVVAPVASHP